MRREGRQHGILRTYRILPPPLNTRLVNSLTSPLTAGLFTKLPSKPAKAHRRVMSGQVHWVRSNDIPSRTWRVMTRPRTGSNFPGLSVTRIVNHNGNVDDCEEAESETMKIGNNGTGSDDYDESMSFYDVGMMMMEKEDVLDNDEEEEDGWCLV